MTPGPRSEPLSAADIQLLTSIGFVAAGAGLHLQALRLFKSLAHLRPLRAFPYIGLATVHLHRQRPDEAAAVLEQGMRLATEDSSSQDRALLASWQGLVLHLAGRAAESARALQHAVHLGPDEPETSLARAMLGLVSSPSAPVAAPNPPSS